MKKTLKQLAGYYKPYKGLFFSDLFFAVLGAGITLIIPLIVRYITSLSLIHIYNRQNYRPFFDRRKCVLDCNCSDPVSYTHL